eukprot:5334981-Ditylum_brightwellii.AAC.1
MLSTTTGIRKDIEACECRNHWWESSLHGRPEALIDLICCKRKKLNHLYIMHKRHPSFLQWHCATSSCQECGVNNKLCVEMCERWTHNTIEIDMLEWIEVPRQDKKNGKQNTQLELGQRRYPVMEVIKKLSNN